jgi:hypothetical protein
VRNFGEKTRNDYIRHVQRPFQRLDLRASRQGVVAAPTTISATSGLGRGKNGPGNGDRCQPTGAPVFCTTSIEVATVSAPWPIPEIPAEL